MEPVHILGRVHGLEYTLGIDLGRQGQLNQNAVNLVAVIQRIHQRQQTLLSGVGGQGDFFAVKPQGLTGLHFTANVNLRGGILAHQNRCQPRRDAGAFQVLNLFGEFRLDLVANLISI